MDFHQNTQPETDSNTPNPINNTTNDGAQASSQGAQPYENSAQPSNQGKQPYGNNAQSPYTNHNGYSYNNYNYSNNGYNYNNNNPYYTRNDYRPNVAEPGSNLAKAALVLGIISIVSCFTFTIYPAFITGSIAIVLALLSKGRRPKLLNKAKNGIICAAIALVLNTVLLTYGMINLFTDPNTRAQVNQMCEEWYGQTFDEMLEEILENSGYSD